MKKNTTPEKRAWGILVAAFSTFLLLCSALAYLAYWFVFKSDVPLDMEVAAAQGTVRVIQPNTLSEVAITSILQDINSNTEIFTDATSQAVVTYYDPRTEVPVASLVLLRDSHIRLVEALSPRYGVNKSSYEIVLEGDVGRYDLFVFDDNQQVSVFVTTPRARIAIYDGGHYSLDVNDQMSQITTITGIAYVTNTQTNRTMRVDQDRRVIVDLNDVAVRLLESESSLVLNANFDQNFEVGWTLIGEGEPAGLVTNMTFDGRQAVLVDRSTGLWPDIRLDHGETGLFQDISTAVNEFEFLEIRSSFYVEEQTLSLCGEQGSECAIMIRVGYSDITGIPREFIHGFYAYRNPSINYPARCATCSSDHEAITMQSWYTYKSGNLLTLLPEEQRPAHIDYIWFYASGHGYKVYVSEMNIVTAP
nr:hypothetical protein [Anaerolineae bacterium]